MRLILTRPLNKIWSHYFHSKNICLRTYHSKLDCFTSTATTFDYPHIQHVVFGWTWNQTKACLAFIYANENDAQCVRSNDLHTTCNFSFRFVLQGDQLSKYHNLFQQSGTEIAVKCCLTFCKSSRTSAGWQKNDFYWLSNCPVCHARNCCRDTMNDAQEGFIHK